MTETARRYTADTINDDALDALYAELMRAAQLAAEERDRAYAAEAAVARALAECSAIDRDVRGKSPVALAGLRTASARIRAALNGAGEEPS